MMLNHMTKHFKIVGPETTREFDIEDDQYLDWSIYEMGGGNEEKEPKNEIMYDNTVTHGKKIKIIETSLGVGADPISKHENDVNAYLNNVYATQVENKISNGAIYTIITYEGQR